MPGRATTASDEKRQSRMRDRGSENSLSFQWAYRPHNPTTNARPPRRRSRTSHCRFGREAAVLASHGSSSGLTVSAVRFDEAIRLLDNWLGRQVIAVTWRPGAHDEQPRPLAGTLSRRDMWPDLASIENPQARGDVDFFNVLRPERQPNLSSPDGATFGLYRTSVTSCDWVPDEVGRAVAFRMSGLPVALWLAD